MRRILHQAQPGVAVNVAGEGVQAEGRTRGQGEDIAARGIHHHHRARQPGHRPLRRLLHAAVHRGDDLGTGPRLLALHQLHRASQRVDLDALAAVTAAQMLVEQTLQPGLARSCRRAR